LAPWMVRNEIVHGKAMLGNELAFTFFWMKPIGKLKEVREAWLALPDHKSRQEAGARAAREVFAEYPQRFFKPVPQRASLMLGWESFISKFLSEERQFYPPMGATGNRLLVVALQVGFLVLYPLAILGLVLLQDTPRKRAFWIFILL